jgi:hypothetical protein
VSGGGSVLQWRRIRDRETVFSHMTRTSAHSGDQ